MDYELKNEVLFNKISHRLKLLFIPTEANNFSSKFLQSKILLYCVVCLLFVKIVSIIIFIDFPKNIFFADITKSALVSLINRERMSLGISPLSENKKLNQAALLKAEDMMKKDYFSHQSPEGVTPWYWFSKSGYNYIYAGENLAIGFINSDDVYRAWINSLSHKDNIINPRYKEIGTAVLTGNFEGNKTTIVVQLFGNPKVLVSPIIEKREKTNPEVIKTEPDKVITDNQFTNEETQNSDIIISNDPVQTAVLSQTAKTSLINNNFALSNFLNPVLYDYNKILNYISYFLIIIIGIVLLLDILINFNIQNRHLILRSILIIILLFATISLNRELINQIIPYKITI